MLRLSHHRSTFLRAAATTTCLLFSSLSAALLVARPAGAAPNPAPALQLDCTQPADAGCPLPLDQAVAAVLSDPSHIHTWTLTVPVAKHLQFVLHGLPADYDLHVYAADGQLLAESIKEGTADDAVTLRDAPAGTYLVYVNSPRGAISDVPYGLLASGEDVAPPPPPPPPPAPTAAPSPTTPPPPPTPASRAQIGIGNASRLTQLATLRGHSSAVQEIAAFADSRLLASAAADGVLKIWDLATFGEVRTIVGARGAAEAVAVSPDGKRLASGADDGRVRLYDVSTGREVWSMEPLPAPVRTLAYSADGRYLAVGGDEPKVRLWDFQGGTVPGSDRPDRPDRPARTWDHRAAVWGVAFSPDGKFLMTASDDGTTRVWDTSSSGTEVRGLRPASGGPNVRSVSVSSDGKYVASAGERAVGVWNLGTGREVQIIEPGAVTSSVAFAPGGGFFAVTIDRSVRLYETETGRELRTLQGHSAPALSVTFTPDSRLLLSAGRDGTIVVWGVE